MKKKDITIALAFPFVFSACLGDDEPVVPPRVYFLSPTAGATVPTEILVRFGVSGFVVKPAGAVEEGSGYLNLFVDVACALEGTQIVASPNGIPLIAGQQELAITLSEGRHSLCVQASDGAGFALAVTSMIEIEVSDRGVQFVSPTEGAQIRGAVPVYLHARNLAVEPSGSVRENAGHFTLAIDRECVEEGDSVVGHSDVINLDGGEHAVTLQLQPGSHRLCLGFADGADEALEYRAYVSFSSY